PEKNDVSGTIALSSNSNEFYSFAKIYLSNAYGDSLGTSLTDAKGKFTFNDIRMNQDFVITIDNKSPIQVSDPLALFNVKGDRVLESQSIENNFVFYVPAQATKKLLDVMDEQDSKIDQLNVNKYVSYKPLGSELAVNNEDEIKGIVDLLKKNQNFNLEYTCHASTKLDPKAAETLTQKHVVAIKNFFLKKGIPAGQIKGISKGNTTPINKCKSGNGASACNDGQHFLNQRTQFRIYKN
ncbi:MAG: OmpA family protein, partial [Bacteroidia bacterium]|nr:OmpA family protein [Bacteroidia bacterium]